MTRNQWRWRRRSAWAAAIVGVVGLELTPVSHDGWRMHPLAFGPLILYATHIAWKDTRA